MMTYLKRIFFILGILCFAAEPQACTPKEKSFPCVKFIKNYDGDTLTVNIPGVHPLLGKKIRIRVNGIDTPEIRGRSVCEKKKAKLAKRLALRISLDKEVILRTLLTRVRTLPKSGSKSLPPFVIK